MTDNHYWKRLTEGSWSKPVEDTIDHEAAKRIFKDWRCSEYMTCTEVMDGKETGRKFTAGLGLYKNFEGGLE